jgi:hypothetical protein
LKAKTSLIRLFALGYLNLYFPFFFFLLSLSQDVTEFMVSLQLPAISQCHFVERAPTFRAGE